MAFGLIHVLRRFDAVYFNLYKKNPGMCARINGMKDNGMNKEYAYLGELGKKVAEIAALPVQQEKKKLWTANNDLEPVRPMVYMDQLPMHEINRSEEMKRHCEDPFLKSVEDSLLMKLYRWKHFPCDMVVENCIDIPKTVRNLNYGMHITEETVKIDAENDIYSHKYEDLIGTPGQLAALKADKLDADPELDKRHLEICNEIFNGIIPVRLEGVQIHCGIWDRIAQMRSVEKILWDIVDRPEFIVDIVRKFVDMTMSTVKQCEELGLLEARMQYIHCTGAYTNDLPPVDFDEDHIRAKDCWSFGMAQLFSTVSPEMHEEFEIDLVKPLYESFGLLYYGCCEPLEKKIGIIRKIRNVRKISVSPWAGIDESADNMGKDYVFSLKSNPAFIAAEFNEREVRAQIGKALAACKRNGTPLEIILKDVSTVSSKLESLDRWCKTAMEMVQS